MTLVKFKLPKIIDVEFSISCEPEDMPFVGNCSAIDEETDKENENYIREELENGNEWAWCSVTVTASYKGIEGMDHLGGCSYKSEKDFKKDGYWEDMKKVAFDDLISNLKFLND